MNLNQDIFKDISEHIVTAFLKYHAENPNVYDLFRKYSLEAWGSGRQHYGIACIMERVRWHIAIETNGDEFKLNNNYKSCYARLLMSNETCLAGFFQTRTRKGFDEARSTYHNDSDHHVRDL